MTNEVLSWDDTGNNQMLASGRASWIQNPISSLRTIEKDNPELAKKICIVERAGRPEGPVRLGLDRRLGHHELVQEPGRGQGAPRPSTTRSYPEASRRARATTSRC